ncbi:transient receptor potential cation channel protein painless-like [Chironomus tepperi]|uniref:transient receptor potential cation channel protein painless-like n=1 Tax=Chironomus tepperi TaxID=113505 RepID=UPI00391F2398
MSHTTCDLHKAFEEKSLKKFVEALEVFEIDPNSKPDGDNRSVFESILSTPDSASYIQKCIEYGADLNVKNKSNKYPLHYLISSQCIDNLKAVEPYLAIDLSIDKPYTKASPYVNVKDHRDQNCLHLLAEMLSNENEEIIIDMMCTLLSYGCNINSPNEERKTPFYIVSMKLPHLKNGQAIFDKILRMTDVDFHTHKGNDIAKMVKDKYIDVIPEKEDFDMCYNEMKKLLDIGDINKFETLFSYYNPIENHEQFLDNCYSYMEIAVQKSYINIVDLLIKKGIDFNRLSGASNADRIPPPFLAYKMANVGIFKSFLLALEHQTNRAQYRLSQCDSGYEIQLYRDGNDHKTLLHLFFSSENSNQCHTIKMSRNEKKCFDLLINDSRCDQKYVNALDEHGKPVIYYSVQYGVDEMTFKLLQKGAYIGPVVTKIRKSLLSDLLDSSITSNHEFHDSKDYEIMTNYGFLMPPTGSCNNTGTNKDGTLGNNISLHTLNGGSRNDSNNDLEQNNSTNAESREQKNLEMNAIKLLADDYDYRQLVMHPVLSSFIFLKWKKIRFALHINLMTTLLFILTFIPYILIDRYRKETIKAMEGVEEEDRHMDDDDDDGKFLKTKSCLNRSI